MMIKYFQPNKNDMIEFTKDQLEKLLNDVYEEGATRENSPTYAEIINSGTIVYNQNFAAASYIYCTDTDSIGRIILEKIKGE